jgi:beta-phosphoglucomutase-like phosphatase (HAD superfamily)
MDGFMFDTKRICRGAAGCFRSMIFWNMPRKSRSAPDIDLKAAKELQVSPQNCMVPADFLFGIQSTHAARMMTVVVLDFVQPDEAQKNL